MQFTVWLRAALRLLARDTHRTVAPYVRRPGPAFGFLVMTGVVAMFPHRRNNTFRKLVTSMLMLTWVVTTLAIAFDVAQLNPYIWGAFTGVTMLVYGQMWELEKYRVSVGPLDFFYGGDEDSQNSED